MSIESFKGIEKRCIGIACKGGYYPLGSQVKIWTDKIKNVLEGTYIGPDYKPTIFTPEERLVLLMGVDYVKELE